MNYYGKLLNEELVYNRNYDDLNIKGGDLMKIETLIELLNRVKKQHGNIEVAYQKNNLDSYEDFFVINEEYEDGWRVNIRLWRY